MPLFSISKRLRELFPFMHSTDSNHTKPCAGEKLVELMAKRNNCSEIEKTSIEKQICSLLPNVLFIATVYFSGEDPMVPLRDRTLHASVGAKSLYESEIDFIMKGNPGFRFARTSTQKPMHLRMLVSKTKKQAWIPLYTNVTKLPSDIRQSTRSALFTFDEVKKLCTQRQGILINPGTETLPIPHDMFR